MSIRSIIIDDEPLAIRVIENHLAKINTFKVVNTFTNPLEAISTIQTENIQVVFLDINMPLINGLDFIQTIQDPPIIIITTAYREFAVDSFELDVLDYLVKPIPFNRFMKSVSKINKALSSSKNEVTEDNKQFVFVKIDKKLHKIYLDSIIYIESLRDYIKIHTSTEVHLVHQTLKSFTATLPKEIFIRVHRSFTISIGKVNAVNGNTLEISDKQIPIGRNYVQEVKEAIFSKKN